MSRGSSAARLPIACRDDALAGGGGPGAMTDPFARQRLDGKVLVVTGAGEGLGAAIARRAAAIGAAGIVVCGRDARRGEAVREELEGTGTEALFVEGTGTEALFVAGDLADPQTALSIVDACDARFGRLDGLVNAAGLSSRGTLDDTSVELWASAGPPRRASTSSRWAWARRRTGRGGREPAVRAAPSPRRHRAHGPLPAQRAAEMVHRLGDRLRPARARSVRGARAPARRHGPA